MAYPTVRLDYVFLMSSYKDKNMMKVFIGLLLTVERCSLVRIKKIKKLEKKTETIKHYYMVLYVNKWQKILILKNY